MTPHGRHTALATRASGVATGCGQNERSRADALRRDRGTLEPCTDARLVAGHRHRVENKLSLARCLLLYCVAADQVKPVDLASVDTRPH
jgi:hypothetical protein